MENKSTVQLYGDIIPDGNFFPFFRLFLFQSINYSHYSDADNENTFVYCIDPIRIDENKTISYKLTLSRMNSNNDSIQGKKKGW